MADSESGSAERVAFDLMVRIAVAENKGKIDPTGRSYYLDLYHQCYRATHGKVPHQSGEPAD